MHFMTTPKIHSFSLFTGALATWHLQISRVDCIILTRLNEHTHTSEDLYWPWLGPRVLAEVTILISALKKNVIGQACSYWLWLYWIHNSGACTCTSMSYRGKWKGNNKTEAQGLKCVGWVSVPHAKQDSAINWIVVMHIWASLMWFPLVQ